MDDATVQAKWRQAQSLAHKGKLAQRIARMIAEELEAAGVTEEDIDRLFPEAAAQRAFYAQYHNWSA